MRNGMSYHKAGMLGYLASKEINEQKYIERIQQYNNNPKHCIC